MAFRKPHKRSEEITAVGCDVVVEAGFDELSMFMFTFVFCSTFEDEVASDFGDVNVGLNIFECGIVI